MTGHRFGRTDRNLVCLLAKNPFYRFGFADGIIGSRTRGDDAHVRAAQSEFHRDQAAGHVADQHRNRKRGDAPRSFVHQHAELVFERFQSTDAAANDHAEAVAIDALEIDAAVLHRHLGRSHGQLNEAIRAADIFRVFEKVFWLKIPNFTADFAIVVRGIEGLNPADAAFAFNEIFPKRLEIVANRRDNTDPCDYDSAVIHKSDE